MPQQRLPQRAVWRHHRFISVGQPRRSQPDRLLAPILVFQVHRGADPNPTRPHLFPRLSEIDQQLADLSDTVADPLQLVDPFQKLSLIRAVAGQVPIAEAGNELLFSFTQLAPLGLQSPFVRQPGLPACILDDAARVRCCPRFGYMLVRSSIGRHATMMNR